MAQRTEFTGRIGIDPPLNRHEIDFLVAFAGSASGPHRSPADGLPTRGRPLSWCQWVPTADGAALVWNGGECFYFYTEWLAYLIDTFLSRRARLRRASRAAVPSGNFTFDHVLTGTVDVRTPAGTLRRITVRDHPVQECVVAGPSPVVRPPGDVAVS
ncbi:MAG: hypothetical protein LPK27_01585 [Rhodococcus sp. (in: high G+C Gram-positive bacteria)]|nr:hypothetical protein [Rhodococcus sp. (in: high G+C Gram-positive bacteria)]